MDIPYIKPIAIAVLLAAWAGSIMYAREDRAAEIYAEWDRDNAAKSESARQTEVNKRLQFEERVAIAERIAKDAQDEAKEMGSKLATATELAGRLRTAKAAAELALARRSDSTPSNPSVPTGPTERVSTEELLGRIDNLEAEIAGFTTAVAGHSQAARIAGLACVAQYNQIKDTQKEKAP